MDATTVNAAARALRRRWWLALGVVVLVLAADALVTLHAPRSYMARASLLIGPSPHVEPGQLVYSVDALGRSMIVGTYANFLSADTVREAALRSLDIPPRPAGSADIEIKTAALADSALVQVSVVAPDPDTAADVANAVGRVGAEQMSQLYPMYALTVVTSATPPATAYRPDYLRNLSLGVLLAATLAVICVSALDALLGPRPKKCVDASDCRPWS
jgi:capsular polysaccharide biosynthesis protein